MIAIIDYNAGNTLSVKNALTRLGFESMLTADHLEIQQAEKVIFPGVGETSTTMKFLIANGLDTLIPKLKQPFLGICLGMQLMCTHSEEGATDCLGIFDASVKKFPPENLVPHMGWNNLINIDSPLFQGITTEDDFYFVHSFYVEENNSSIAQCDYILPFCAALQKDNFYATQFHPEKSASSGERLLKNFLAL